MILFNATSDLPGVNMMLLDGAFNLAGLSTVYLHGSLSLPDLSTMHLHSAFDLAINPWADLLLAAHKFYQARRLVAPALCVLTGCLMETRGSVTL